MPLIVSRSTGQYWPGTFLECPSSWSVWCFSHGYVGIVGLGEEEEKCCSHCIVWRVYTVDMAVYCWSWPESPGWVIFVRFLCHQVILFFSPFHIVLWKEVTIYSPFLKNREGSKFLAWFQFSSVAQSCLTLCNPMNCSTPGLPVHHQLPEFTQTHVHWVGDAIQPSHPLSSPSPPALNLSQHQGLKWVSSSHQVAKVLEFQLQHQSHQWTPRTDLL